MEQAQMAGTGIVRARQRRARSGRAMVTDRLLLDAAAVVIRTRGWGATSVFAVAKQAGLSSRTVTDRYASRSHLGVSVWRDGPAAALGEVITDLLRAALPPTGQPQRAEAAIAALERLARPSDEFEVSVQLMCAAPFDDVLRAAMAEDIQAWVEHWYHPDTPEGRTRAAQAVYLLVCAFGLLLARHRPGAADVRLAPVLRPTLAVLLTPAPASPLPAVEAAQMRLDPVGPEIVDDHDALLAATILHIADHGYEESTLDRIVASVGVTQGKVFSRHRSKAELFVAAIQWRTEYALKRNEEWNATLAGTIGPGLAEAVTWREYLRPEHKRGRALALEQVRVGWHEPAVQAQHDAAEASFAESVLAVRSYPDSEQARSDIHLGLAMGYGAELLPEFLPDAWTLPIDVVTVALLEASGAQ